MSISSWDKEHIKNIERYASLIDKIYQSAVQEAAALSGMIGHFNKAKPFSFVDYPETKKRVEKLLRKLQKEVKFVVLDGIESAWTLSNNKNNELCNVVFGNNKGKLTKEQERKYYATNDKARKAFELRKTAGLSLSERVWKYSDQFKQEIEMGLDIGLRDGLSAQEMSRELRQYLKNPGKLFRRVRDEHGVLHLSKQAAAFHPGQGVYRSSYKNAMRLARTEVNMSYRTADHIRWQQLDFVVGIEIRLSNNHTLNGVHFYDICDELKGKYPKDFKFTGWHPQCRCYVVTILKSPAEMKADTQRILNGENPTAESKNRVSDVPDAFKKWVTNNKERIERSSSLPYFIRDNEKYIPQMRITNAAAKGVLEAQAFNEAILTKPTAMERAAIRHTERTPEQVEAIKSAWYERRAVRHYGENILRYMGGISDIDTTALQIAMGKANLKDILAEAKALKVKGKELLSLKYLDNPIQTARNFSANDAKIVNDVVEKKIKSFSGLELEDQIKKLQFEITWVEDHKKYETWQAARDAYKKELSRVQELVKWKDVDERIAALKSYTTKSAVYKSAVEKVVLARSKAVSIESVDDLIKNAEATRNRLRGVKIKGVETLDDLKKKLGESIPATLRELDVALSNYQYTNKTLASNEAEVNALMKKLFDDNDLGMDVNVDLLDSIFDKGFLNTFETGTSNGYLGSRSKTGKIDTSHARLIMSHKMFMPSKRDLSLSQLKRSDYEKYGHLIDRDKYASMKYNCTHYGNVQVRFKREKVLCTWTFDDSLSPYGEYYQPSLVSDPKIQSFDNKNSKINISQNDKWGKLHEWQREDGHRTRYVELQYHGSLSIDDVESITFNGSPEKYISSDFIAKLKAKGVEIWYIDGAGVKKY